MHAQQRTFQREDLGIRLLHHIECAFAGSANGRRTSLDTRATSGGAYRRRFLRNHLAFIANHTQFLQLLQKIQRSFLVREAAKRLPSVRGRGVALPRQEKSVSGS